MLKSKTGRMIEDMNFFFKQIIQSSLIFEDGVNNYLKGNKKDFERHVKKIDELESEIDDLRKKIEYNLYSKMLIPESRGDILGFLENIDDVVNTEKFVLMSFDIEQPEIPPMIKDGMLEMSTKSRLAVEELVKAADAFLNNGKDVKIETEKVFYYEHEIDQLESDMKRLIFKSHIHLSHKLHIRDIIEKLASLSDCCETVAEKIIISTIKREI